MRQISVQPFVRATSPPWSVRFDELLADGKWHDGREIVRTAEKLIPPGRAMRRYEQERISNQRRAALIRGAAADQAQGDDGAEDEDEVQDATEDDGTDLSLGIKIAKGKDILMRKIVSTRHKSGRCEVSPEWPLSRATWVRPGAWEIRDVAAGYFSMKELAKRFPISQQRLRMLVLADPAIPHKVVGNFVRVHQTNLDDLERRYCQHLLDYSEGRLQAASHTSVESDYHVRGRSYITRTDLAVRYGLSTRTVAAIQDANQELNCVTVGRSTRMPLSSLPLWEEALEVHFLGTFDRRSAGVTYGKTSKMGSERRDP